MTWTIDGVEAPADSDIELTATTLSLSFETSKLPSWQAIGERAGDIETTTGFGGQLRAYPRGTADSVTVTPPNEFSPPFISSEWLVDGFDAEKIVASRHEVSLDLVRTRNRADETTLTEQETTAADEGFGADFGREFGTGDPDIVAQLTLRDGTGLTLGITERQLGRISREGSPRGESVTVPLLLSDAQAAALIDAAGYPGGVVSKPVPDGDNRVADETSGRQTLRVEGDTVGGFGTDFGATFGVAKPVNGLDNGAWLVDDWSIAWHSFNTNRRWLAELTLIQPQ